LVKPPPDDIVQRAVLGARAPSGQAPTWIEHEPGVGYGADMAQK
jgi:hypothetical protein